MFSKESGDQPLIRALLSYQGLAFIVLLFSLFPLNSYSFCDLLFASKTNQKERVGFDFSAADRERAYIPMLEVARKHGWSDPERRSLLAFMLGTSTVSKGVDRPRILRELEFSTDQLIQIANAEVAKNLPTLFRVVDERLSDVAVPDTQLVGALRTRSFVRQKGLDLDPEKRGQIVDLNINEDYRLHQGTVKKLVRLLLWQSRKIGKPGSSEYAWIEGYFAEIAERYQRIFESEGSVSRASLEGILFISSSHSGSELKFHNEDFEGYRESREIRRVVLHFSGGGTETLEFSDMTIRTCSEGGISVMRGGPNTPQVPHSSSHYKGKHVSVVLDYFLDPS